MSRSTTSHSQDGHQAYFVYGEGVESDQSIWGQQAGGPSTLPDSNSVAGTDESHIPQPPNCFMIFRKEMRHLEGSKDEKKRSGYVANLWNRMTEDEKEPWREKARIAKIEHLAKHPGYKRRAKKKPNENKGEGQEMRNRAVSESNKINTQEISVPSYRDQNQNQINEFTQNPTWGYVNFPPAPMYLPTHISHMYQQELYQHEMFGPSPTSGSHHSSPTDPFSYVLDADGCFVPGPPEIASTSRPQPFPNQDAGNFGNLTNFTPNEGIPRPEEEYDYRRFPMLPPP